MNTYRKQDDSVSIQGTILRESEKAIQFNWEDTNGKNRTDWFPISQLNEIHRTHERDGVDVLVMTGWIALTKKVMANG